MIQSIMKSHPVDTEDSNKNDHLIRTEWHGRTAPPFTTHTLSGDTISLKHSLDNTPVMLNFFASWCRPCRTEMPKLEKFYKNNSNRITVLAINVGESAQKVRKFVHNIDYRHTVLLDPRKKIAGKYDITSLPSTVFIDQSRKIQYYEIGQIDNFSKVIPAYKTGTEIRNFSVSKSLVNFHD